MADQARVADSTDEARVLAEQARGKLDQGRAAIEDTIRIFSGPHRSRRPARRPHGRLRRGDGAGAERLLRDRDDRQQDQHARAQRHHRGGAGRRGGPLVRGRRRRGQEARPRHPRRDRRDRRHDRLADPRGRGGDQRDQGRRREEPGRAGRASPGSTTPSATSPTSSPWSTARPTASPSRPAIIQPSVDSVKSGLSSFAADARDNGGQLKETHERLTKLELLSNEMLDRLASSGVRIDDTPFIEFAQTATPRDPGGRSRPASRRGEVGDRGGVRHRLCRDARHQPDPVGNPLLRLRRRPCPPGARPADGARSRG